MSRASCNGRPLIIATTRRTFVGDMWTYFAVARARAGSSTAAGAVSAAAVMTSLSFVCSGSAPARLAVVLDMAPEGPGGSELPQLVADHRVGHEDRHVLAAVVHRDRVADHVRDDGGPPGPGPDDGLAARLVEGVHLLEQVVVHERALLQAARHVCTSPAQRFLPVRRRRTIILSDGLWRRGGPPGLPAGFTRGPAPGGFAPPP